MAKTTSRDGTVIGYETVGDGPPLITVAGATQYRAVDRATPKMAAMLGDAFTVVMYDRRGRGESGNTLPFAPAREVEDIAALVGALGGTASLYGMSSGAVLALEAAAALPDAIEKVVCYEPPINVGQSAEDTWAGVHRMEAFAAAGDGDGAMASFMSGVGMPPEAVSAFKASPGWPAFAAVGTTIAHDFRILAEAWADGVPDRWSRATMPVLVVDGDASFPFMAAGADAVAAALPNATRQTLAGQTHDIAPDAIVPVIRAFVA